MPKSKFFNIFKGIATIEFTENSSFFYFTFFLRMNQFLK